MESVIDELGFLQAVVTLEQYKEDPHGFEDDIDKMWVYLTFTGGLTNREADFIVLTFHSEVRGRPYLEIAEEEQFYDCF